MSDSSSKTYKRFDPVAFVKQLEIGKKLLVAHHQLKFEEGWADIFADFVSAIKNLQVIIISADDRHDFLDIEVDLSKTSHAKEVYSAILKAKHESLAICARCGVAKKKGNGIKYCQYCNSKVNRSNKTGTWLDEY
ncbi:hypothetical protein ACIDE9_00675 [Methylophilus sp. 'Pure River']|uniref:hypothetical protein n=1 Tax=Methylophilus sp. 'Pure River' TaxID=3377117 RepID=UPI00398ED918